MSQRSHHFEVPPDPSLMEDIGATSFTVAEAIVELVANSLDARLDDGSPVVVDVHVSQDEIRVVDDAQGMNLERLKESVRLGAKMDLLAGKARKRKGKFGLGMKTAAASLGRSWSIVTRAIDTSTELEVSFDLSSYSRRGGKGNFKWDIDIVERPRGATGVLTDQPHGTAIIIRKLRERDPFAGTVLQLLGSAYSPHIEAGDRFIVNGVDAPPPQYDFVPNSRQDIAISLDTEGKKEIRGWVALDKRTHNSGDYGFNLYRENQLIEPWNKEWFPPHLMTSRIIGVAHLDFAAVNFHKKGFETQDPDWKLATSSMKEFLRPVVKASREMSRGKNETKYAKAVDGLRIAMGSAPTVNALTASDEGPETVAVDEGEARPASSVQVEPNTLLLLDGPVSLSFVVEDFSSDLTPWDYIYDSPSQALQAVLNKSSKVFEQISDQKFLGILALADSVTRFLVEQKGFTAGRAREIRDQWLYIAIDDRHRQGAKS